ncbi:MAG TPA: anhydro-N-acetylmuramic acid kinase [Chitinophagaceae bacterium]|nr:anhydro-N-acetylmuramic acid kinase [Chitinophagaceae bacterium]
MVYRVIGIMSGSSLDGLDLAFVQFEEQSGKWVFEILEAECLPYTPEWIDKLKNAINLSAREYMLLDAEYGHYIGKQVNAFMETHLLQYKVALVCSHGHTSFHMPPIMTGQLGHGAAIAAETGLPVVTDLRAVDVALGGQGAPIVPMGEKLLWKDTELFLNIGGIANLSVNAAKYLAYDICPANRVLNMLAAQQGLDYDAGGRLAASGAVDQGLLKELNAQPYYQKPYPKSLANDFGTDIIYPMLTRSGLGLIDLLSTYTEHIAIQVAAATEKHIPEVQSALPKMMVTGGGAFNDHLMNRLQAHLEPIRVSVERPDDKLVNYKEALIMGLLGVLRWREDVTTLASVTGASRNSVGGALWISS